jgi:hypothetical protein
MMIINDDSRVISKLETSLTDDARVVIYNHHMFIVQATDMTKRHFSKFSIHLKSIYIYGFIFTKPPTKPLTQMVHYHVRNVM